MEFDGLRSNRSQLSEAAQEVVVYITFSHTITGSVAQSPVVQRAAISHR